MELVKSFLFLDTEIDGGFMEIIDPLSKIHQATVCICAGPQHRETFMADVFEGAKYQIQPY